jgi:SnoaL-like polyketide cyclase
MGGTARMTENSKAQIVAALGVAKRSKNLAALIELYHPDCILEQPGLGSRSVGHGEIATALVRFLRYFPDYVRTEEGAADAGDIYLSWGPANVTLTGTFDGYPASGASASLMTFIRFKFQDEKIIYEGHHWDTSIICESAKVPLQAIKNELSQILPEK